jgi:hypothetical protein
MPLYTYKAIDAAGKAVMGRTDAATCSTSSSASRAWGSDLVSGAPTAQKAASIAGSKVPRQDLINFCFTSSSSPARACRSSRADRPA